MADETRRGGGSGVLAFIVGVLVVVIAVLGYVMWTGNGLHMADNRNVEIEIHAPNLPKLPTPQVPVLPPQNVPHPQ